MFMNTCGGHADPYHIHTDPVCNYETDSATGHSTLLGVSLDGYGIYGKFETHNNQRPCDLDVCHGHVGSVPASSVYGVASSSVYHHHVSDYDSYPFTWTLGCYGNPTIPTTLATCESLYDGCGGETATIFTDEYPDGLDITLWCPCFEVPEFEGCGDTLGLVPTPAPTPAPTTAAPTPTTVDDSGSSTPCEDDADCGEGEMCDFGEGGGSEKRKLRRKLFGNMVVGSCV